MRSTVTSAGGYVARRLRVVGVMPLARENGRQARSPDLLHRGQDAQLVVHQDVVSGRVTLLDVVQLLLLMDVDQHAAFDGLVQPGTLDLARLEDHVAVGQDDRRPPGLELLDHVQRAGNRRLANG